MLFTVWAIPVKLSKLFEIYFFFFENRKITMNLGEIKLQILKKELNNQLNSLVLLLQKKFEFEVLQKK